uniref:rhomboid protease n=1 Tax=Corethron hystrix TaxID=216773 RepID=A0A7S1FMY0_9STRA|mmetsp:Transcript_1400/g.2901  ORF Transcript_1400/g.2901 Transcript_1400/m.2901 type:complete len:421 (+) Transcript_1400:91-1353(+)
MDKSLIDDAIEDCVSIESGGNTFGTSKSQTPSTTSAASYGNQFFIRRHESSPEEYTSASSRRAIFNIENVKKKPSVFDDKDSYVSDATWQPIAPLSKPAAALSENLARKYSGMAPIEEESIYCVSMRPGSPPCNILSDRNDKLIISHIADRSDKRIISHIDGPASEYIGDINSSFDDRSYAVDDTMIVTKETYENKRSKNNCDLPPPVPLEGRTEENYCNGKVLSFKEDVDIVWNENENKKQTSKLKRGSMDHIASRYVYYDNDAILEDEGSVYYVKQKYAYFVLIVSAVQIFLFAIMSGTCGIAPLDINQLLGPYPEALSIWGAKNTWGLLVRNEWWRLFSSSMLHAGVVHLIINVAVQVETSAFFEREWGWLRYILVYFLSSFNSTVASCIMEPASISVGSSGALMEIFGAKVCTNMH